MASAKENRNVVTKWLSGMENPRWLFGTTEWAGKDRAAVGNIGFPYQTALSGSQMLIFVDQPQIRQEY